MFGNRSMMNRAGLCVMSSHTCSAPLFFISLSIARATTSRGASDFNGCHASMNSLPSSDLSTPPSPRTASLMRNDFAFG